MAIVWNQEYRDLCFSPYWTLYPWLCHQNIGIYVFLRTGHFILDCVTRITIVRNKGYQTDFYAIFLFLFYYLLLRSKYLFQCSLLEQSHLCFSTYTMRRNFSPIKRERQNYILVYLKLQQGIPVNKITVFCVVTSCSLVDTYLNFEVN